jgi:hypothetical protein
MRSLATRDFGSEISAALPDVIAAAPATCATVRPVSGAPEPVYEAAETAPVTVSALKTRPNTISC